MTTNDLRQLLCDLGLKTPPDQIAGDSREPIISFLKQETRYRREWRIKRLMSSSGIRPAQLRTFDGFDWSFNPILPKEDLFAFRKSPWIEEGANLLLIGDAGLGKSHIAKALCYEAILSGHSACFITAFDLISKIKKKAPNVAPRVEYYGGAVQVLAIDELGYTYHSKEDGDLLFQIISKRSERYPTIITTNLAPKQWGSLFSGPAASAILDRLSYNGKFITLEGKSYRLRTKRK